MNTELNILGKILEGHMGKFWLAFGVFVVALIVSLFTKKKSIGDKITIGALVLLSLITFGFIVIYHLYKLGI